MINNQISPLSSNNLHTNKNNRTDNSNDKNKINDVDVDVEFDFAMCHGYYDCWGYRGYNC